MNLEPKNSPIIPPFGEITQRKMRFSSYLARNPAIWRDKGIRGQTSHLSRQKSPHLPDTFQCVPDFYFIEIRLSRPYKTEDALFQQLDISSKPTLGDHRGGHSTQIATPIASLCRDSATDLSRQKSRQVARFFYFRVFALGTSPKTAEAAPKDGFVTPFTLGK